MATQGYPLPLRLPEPDKHGNYWFGEHAGDEAGPAIFPSKRLKMDDKGNSVVENTGKFLVLLGGHAKGFLCDANGFPKRFDTLKAAFKALDKALEKSS